MQTKARTMLARGAAALAVLTVLEGCASEAGEGQRQARLGQRSEALTEARAWVRVHDGAAPVRPPPRQYAAYAYDPLRKVTWLYGGHVGQLTYNDLWSWDGHTWKKHTPQGKAPFLRTFPMGAFDDARGVFLVLGGVTEAGYFDDVWAWNGVNAFTELESMPAGRANGLCAYDTKSDLLVVPGGNVGGTLAKTTVVRVGENWTTPSALFPQGRAGYAIAYDPKRKAVMLDGGHDVSGDTLFWNATTESWDVVTTNFTNPRFGHRLVTDTVRERVLMSPSLKPWFGGGNDAELLRWREWDGNTWEPIDAAGPSMRQHIALSHDSERRRVVLFGGADEGLTTAYDDTWEYDPEVTAWAEVNVVPSPSSRMVSAFDEARGRSVVLTQDGQETWLFDGKTWAHALPRTTQHPKRAGVAMAYDALRKRVVTFGGAVDGGGDSNETWLWDGGDWKKVEGLPQTPPARSGHVLVWDAARGVVVMTGGTAASTWEWNGSAWTQTVSTDLPTPMVGLHGAFDPVAGSVMVGGGKACDTFVYKAPVGAGQGSWTTVDECNVANEHAASVTDAVRKKVIYFGGVTPDGTKIDDSLYEWGGAAWAKMTVAGSPGVPGARTMHGMVFEAAANRVLLFGGQDQTLQPRNDVWAYQVTLSGCDDGANVCPAGLVCSAGECVLPGQGAGGAAGAGGSSGGAGQGGAGQGGAGQAGAGQAGAGQAGAGQAGAGQAGAGQAGAGQGGAAGEAGAGGVGGATGGVGGAAGEAGTAGASGEGGAGGAGAGGAGGEGGASAGGGGGAGGAASGGDGGAGGDAGAAGFAGAGGDVGAAGFAGAGGDAGAGGGGAGGAGGDGAGGGAGAAGVAGMVGAAGAPGSGGAGASGYGGSAGSSAAGMAAGGTGGAAGLLPSSGKLFGVEVPDGAGSCGCRMTRSPTGGQAFVALLPALVWSLRRRRRAH